MAPLGHAPGKNGAKRWQKGCKKRAKSGQKGGKKGQKGGKKGAKRGQQLPSFQEPCVSRDLRAIHAETYCSKISKKNKSTRMSVKQLKYL